MNIELYDRKPLEKDSLYKVIPRKDWDEVSDFGKIIPYVSYGNETDLWGIGWNADNLNSYSFGVAIRVIAPDLDSTASIDHVRITVYYTLEFPRFEQGYPQINYTNNGINNKYRYITLIS